MKHLNIMDLKRCDYLEAYRIQKHVLACRKRNEAADTLIFAEHHNVLTMGRSGSKKNILVPDDELAGNGLKVHNMDRGGDVTFHGEGQIVFYPVVDLKGRGRDIRMFIRGLEDVVGRVLARHGVQVDSNHAASGVWSGGAKIGFIGIGISGWVTYHGASLNLNVDKRYFSMINPCGFSGMETASLSELCGYDVTYKGAREDIIRAFKEVFGYDEHCFIPGEARVA